METRSESQAERAGIRLRIILVLESGTGTRILIPGHGGHNVQLWLRQPLTLEVPSDVTEHVNAVVNKVREPQPLDHRRFASFTYPVPDPMDVVL